MCSVLQEGFVLNGCSCASYGTHSIAHQCQTDYEILWYLSTRFAGTLVVIHPDFIVRHAPALPIGKK